MFRRTLEFTEVCAAIFVCRMEANFTNDLVSAFTTLSGTTIRSGDAKRILFAVGRIFQRITATRCIESVVTAALILKSGTSPLCRHIVAHTVCHPIVQDLMFRRFYVSQFLRWLARKVYPRFVLTIGGALCSAMTQQPIYDLELSFIQSASSAESAARSMDSMTGNTEPLDVPAEVFAEFRESDFRAGGTVSGVFKANFISFLCSILLEQSHWVGEYVIAHNKGLSWSRTLRPHIAAMIFNFCEVGLSLGIRSLGSAVGGKMYPSSLGLGRFYGEHVLLLATLPLIAITSDKIAMKTFVLLARVLPSSTLEDENEDIREEEDAKFAENEEREGFDAAVSKGGDGLYSDLGVSPSASPAEIRKAYRTLALQCHPDKVAGKPAKEQQLAAEHMSRINHAYGILSSEQKRATYNMQRAAGVDPSGDGRVRQPVPPFGMTFLTKLPFPMQLGAALCISFISLNAAGFVAYLHLGAVFKKTTALGRVRLG